MIIGLGVSGEKISFVEKEITFDTKPLSNELNQVLYHPTLKKISDQGATKLIIPDDIDECDYSYEDLIEHIRTDSNEVIALIPILVYIEDEKKFDLNKYLETKLESIAVALSSNPKIEDFIDKFDKKDLDTYKDKECYKLPYKLGSHDKTNHWGSLTLLKSLSHFNPNNKDIVGGLSELEGKLSEWTYFKKLIRKFDSDNVDENYIVRLRSEMSKLLKISKKGTVLVIEDQLKDGWKVAYYLFFTISSNFKVLFAENEIEAKEKINKTDNIDLVLLDVRLNKDRDKNQDEHGHHIENLSGVKLAKWIRGEAPTIPIIAATASNKSWTLEALLEQGINGYWVKGSPDLETSVEVGIENTLDLYKKIYRVLLWSQKTGNWQKKLYRIADVVGGKNLKLKAQSLQALLFSSFSPFSNELSEGLQLNLAFMNIYSCMNDLVEWACVIKEVEANVWEWSTIDNSNKYVEIIKVQEGLWVVDSKAQLLKLKEIGVIKKNAKWRPQTMQPDSQMAVQLFAVKFDSNDHAKEFIKLRKIRNQLPLVHGNRKASGSGSYSSNASTLNINSLIHILGSFVDRHKKLIDKYEE